MNLNKILMRFIFCFMFIVFSVFSVFSQKHYIDDYVLPSHPRLLLFNGEEKLLKENIKRDVLWTDICLLYTSDAADE